MRKSIFFLIVLYRLTVVNAQTDLKHFVIQNAVSISAIDPDSIDFNDLDFIGKAIGSSRIVMLGEQDHGDAPTFLAKTRLIKYLHEKMDFNVLAFESDFFGLNLGFDRLEKNRSNVDDFLRKNVYPIWTYCHTCHNLLYNYIPSFYQTEKPLMVTGFDNQLALDFSSNYLVLHLDSLLQALNLPIVKHPNYLTEILPLIDSLKYYSFKDTSNYSKCENYLNQIKDQVGGNLEENNFWMQVINNLLSANKTYWFSKRDYVLSNNTRDAQMASNLKWLKEVKFPNEKIIVWAANEHVAKFIDSSGKDGRKMITMGRYFTDNDKYLNETYIIGFTSFQGEAGRLGFKTYPVRSPKSNGFENWINKKYDYAFVDFKAYNANYPNNSQEFYLKGLGHNSAFKKDWTKVFDGVFFIRTMYPCQR